MMSFIWLRSVLDMFRITYINDISRPYVPNLNKYPMKLICNIKYSLLGNIISINKCPACSLTESINKALTLPRVITPLLKKSRGFAYYCKRGIIYALLGGFISMWAGASGYPLIENWCGTVGMIIGGLPFFIMAFVRQYADKD